ncbi:hypothetical protein BC831DRAFT_469265 [Entophlyctis helioformis]|nr:hypothetical protein BC831DRAFT_469265 [Entophlyctis helioformis]
MLSMLGSCVLRVPLLLVLLLLSSISAHAASLRGRIATNLVLTDLADLPINSKVIINFGELVSQVSEDGEFFFPSIPDGSHQLQIMAGRFGFDTIRLDTAAGKSWSRIGSYLSTPLVLEPLGSYNVFKEREKFNIMSLFMNPMLLMTGVTLALFFVLPKMQAMADEQNAKASSGSADECNACHASRC